MAELEKEQDVLKNQQHWKVLEMKQGIQMLNMQAERDEQKNEDIRIDTDKKKIEHRE